MRDDYDLIDQDIDEFIRRGLEAFDMDPHPGSHRMRKEEEKA